MKCYRCGAENPDGLPYCYACGNPLSAPAQPEQPAQPAYQQPAQPEQPAQPAYQQPAYQQPAQPAYQQPYYPQPKKSGKLALWIIIGVLVAAGIGVGLFFLLRSKDDGGSSSSNGGEGSSVVNGGDSSSYDNGGSSVVNDGDSAELTMAAVSGRYNAETINGKSLWDYYYEQYIAAGYDAAEAESELRAYGLDPYGNRDALYITLNADGSASANGTMLSYTMTGTWRLSGNQVITTLGGSDRTYTYSNGTLTQVRNGETMVMRKDG